MRSSSGHYLAVTLAVILMAFACTPTGLSDTTGDTIQSEEEYPAVSITDTPVQYVDLDGVSFGYREFGAGEPILMIASFGGVMDNWNQTFIGILASKYHVYTFDNRGMGYSGDDDAPPELSLYAGDAARMIDALGYDRMHVYGVSMGSSIAQQLVIDTPDKVDKLVLDSSSYSIRLPETEQLLGLIESSTGPDNPAGVREEAEANLAWNGTWDGLSGIDKNVLLLVGTDDKLTPDAISVSMAGQIPGSWLIRFMDVPHAGCAYAPVEYGESVLTFLGMDESPLTP